MTIRTRPVALVAALWGLWSCGSSTEPAQQPNSGEPIIEEEPAYIQYEETMPDSGLIQEVNPEEIITDDWSDEGDLELDTEQ